MAPSNRRVESSPRANPHDRAARAFRAGQYSTARRILRALLRHDPNDGEAWILLGDVLHVRDDNDEAARAYANGARLKPTDPYPLLRLGDILTEHPGAPKRAVKVLQRAARLAPRHPEVWIRLSEAHASAGQTARSVAACRRVLLLDPGDVATRVRLGSGLAQLGRLGSAERELRAALRLEPRDPDALCALGEVFVKRRRLGDAEGAFRELVRRCPKDPYPRVLLAEVLRDRGNRREAARQVKAVVRLEPRWRHWVEDIDRS